LADLAFRDLIGYRILEITVVICTRNRRASLERTLASIARCHVTPGLAWEVLVVDNGSSDETSAVIRNFASQMPIRSIREEVAGLSHARNAGVRHARGDYLIWTDDDVLVDEYWLDAYWCAFNGHPGAAFFGGRVHPVLEPPTPAWLSDNLDLLENLLAARDFGDEPFEIHGDDDRLPFGASYAVRTSDQRRHSYDPELGVSPTLRRSGEETQVLRAIMDEGGVGRWVPNAKVSHIIPARRQTLAYVVEHYRAYGETAAYLAARRGATMPLAARSRWEARYGLVKSLVAIALGGVLSKQRFRLRHACFYGYHRGFLSYRSGAGGE